MDFKIEFGRQGKTIRLGDEISMDSMRLWDKKTRESLDKDVYRFNKGDVMATYNRVAAGSRQRLHVLPVQRKNQRQTRRKGHASNGQRLQNQRQKSDNLSNKTIRTGKRSQRLTSLMHT